jgi:hypothetical protein
LFHALGRSPCIPGRPRPEAGCKKIDQAPIESEWSAIYPPGKNLSANGHAATLAGAGIGLGGKDLAEGRLVSLMPDYQPGCKPAAAIPCATGEGDGYLIAHLSRDGCREPGGCLHCPAGAESLPHASSGLNDTSWQSSGIVAP